MRKSVVSIIFLLSWMPLSTTDSATSSTPRDFQYYVDLTGPIKSSTLYQIHLPADILKKCAAECSDMRLFDLDQNETPYVIVENESPGEKNESYTLKITRYTDQMDSVVITMGLPEKHQPISLVDLDIADRDFFKNAVLYGSHDMKAWNKLAEDTLYDFSSQVDLRKTMIQFTKSDYRYYRLKLIDVQRTGNDHPSIRLKYEGLDFSVDNLKNKKLRINKIVGNTASKTDRTVVYDDAVFTNFSAHLDGNRNTIIILDADLPVDRISFDISNPYYYRKLSIHTSDTGKEDSYRFFTQDSIYSFQLSGITQARNDTAHRIPKHRYYKFIIENQNNPPLNIRSIKFEWVRKNLYFAALSDSGKYALYFGNETVHRPDYDLSNFIRQDNWFEQKYAVLETTQARQNANYIPTVSKDKRAQIEKRILTGTVILLVLGIGYWLYKLTGKALKQGGA